MDTFRHVLTLLMLMFMPGAVLFWFQVHPFVRFWRRIGLRRTLAINYTLLAAFAVGVFLLRKTLLAVDFGTNPLLIAVAVPLLAASIVLLANSLRAVLDGYGELLDHVHGDRDADSDDFSY